MYKIFSYVMDDAYNRLISSVKESRKKKLSLYYLLYGKNFHGLENSNNIAYVRKILANQQYFINLPLGLYLCQG